MMQQSSITGATEIHSYNILYDEDPAGEASAVMIDDATIKMVKRAFIFNNLTNHLNPDDPYFDEEHKNGWAANLAIWLDCVREIV